MSEERDTFIEALIQERDALQIAVRELYLYIVDEVDVMPFDVGWYIPRDEELARAAAKVACADVQLSNESTSQ